MRAISTLHVLQVSPIIAPHVQKYVHHMLMYLCSRPLNDSLVGQTAPCFGGISPDIFDCTLNGVLIAGWAVGGEVIIVIITVTAH